MTRIELSDSVQSAIIKMAEGNPGAVRVLCELFKWSPTIDPQSALGGLGPILSLDTEGIYGSQIWVLYKDVCGQSILNVLALLRAKQMGVLTGGLFDYGRDFAATLNALKAELPTFAP